MPQRCKCVHQSLFRKFQAVIDAIEFYQGTQTKKEETVWSKIPKTATSSFSSGSSSSATSDATPQTSMSTSYIPSIQGNGSPMKRYSKLKIQRSPNNSVSHGFVYYLQAHVIKQLCSARYQIWPAVNDMHNALSIFFCNLHFMLCVGFRPSNSPKSSSTRNHTSTATSSTKKTEKQPSVARRRTSKKERNSLKEAEVLNNLQDICATVDPSEIYKDIVKIGQGQAAQICSMPCTYSQSYMSL